MTTGKSEFSCPNAIVKGGCYSHRGDPCPKLRLQPSGTNGVRNIWGVPFCSREIPPKQLPLVVLKSHQALHSQIRRC